MKSCMTRMAGKCLFTTSQSQRYDSVLAAPAAGDTQTQACSLHTPTVPHAIASAILARWQMHSNIWGCGP
jgi:hypothetical protein